MKPITVQPKITIRIPVDAARLLDKWNKGVLINGKVDFTTDEMCDLEKFIATDAYASLWYAKYVLKQRFPLGEPTVLACAMHQRLYAESFNLDIDSNGFTKKKRVKR